MIKYLFLTILLSVHCYCVTAQQKLSSKELQVQETIIALFKSLADLDFEQMKERCTGDFSVLEHGVIWNLDTLQEKINLNKNIPDFSRVNSLGQLSQPGGLYPKREEQLCAMAGKCGAGEKGEGMEASIIAFHRC